MRPVFTSPNPEIRFVEIVRRVTELSNFLRAFTSEERAAAKASLKARVSTDAMREMKALFGELESLIRDMSPAVAGRIQITLGRSDSIAKYFAFNFVQQPKLELGRLGTERFLGSGVYAIYYHGTSEPAYLPIAKSETPIYIGKADPDAPYAETTTDQGAKLHFRLGEHAKSIKNAGLSLDDFRFRVATIQSGMQAAVEEFLIRLFRPIWNKEIKVAFGIGKHGDAATTRANKRSPWDTMHPGRKWALLTTEDQVARKDIEAKIAAHFTAHPPYKTLDEVWEVLRSS